MCALLLPLLGEAFNKANQVEFEAVQKLHIHLDDDKDGDVDFSESKEVGQLLKNYYDNLVQNDEH